MPNHVKNRITGPVEVITKLIGTDSEGEPGVDFQLIIPMPKDIVSKNVSLNVKDAAEIALGLIDFQPSTVNASDEFQKGNYASAASVLHVSNCTRQLLKGPMPKDFSDEDFETFIEYLKAYRNCGGLMDWYDWSVAMWGTKWNAYAFNQASETEITFETAWSAPHPVMERLNEITKQDFKHEWADENTGNNVGFREYKSKVGFGEQEFSRTKEGYELAFSLRPEYREDYEFDGVEYKYREEE